MEKKRVFGKTTFFRRKSRDINRPVAELTTKDGLYTTILRDCQHNHKPADAETLSQATKAVKAATKTIEASNSQYESDTIDIRSNAKVLKQLAERDMPTKGLKF